MHLPALLFQSSFHPSSRRALFYLAQHHDKLGNTAEALRLVDRCIEVR